MSKSLAGRGRMAVLLLAASALLFAACASGPGSSGADPARSTSSLNGYSQAGGPDTAAAGAGETASSGPGGSEAAGSGAAASQGGIWRPRPSTRPWQFQLQGKIDTSIKAPVYEVDGFDVSAATVRKLHSQGRKVICYFSAGSWENYRPDRGQFPRSVLGKRYDGYPDERWLDIRNYRKFSKPLINRFRMCASKGFDGVETDNVAGYQNPTGFPLTAADQLEFNRWLARQAHRFGLSIGLKNDPSQARQLVRDFDFAVVEECFQFNECGPFRSFVRAGKAVFAVEYEIPNSRFCRTAKQIRFSAIGKELALFARPWRPCPS